MKATPVPNGNGHAAATVVAVRPRSKPQKLPALPASPTLLAAIIQASSDPAVDVGKVRELVELHKTLQEREWQRAFNDAMTACQTELQPIARNQSNTSTNSRYADLAALAEGALPIIHRNGFALTLGEVATTKAGHIGVAVRVSHRDGHVERTEFHVPLDLCGFKGTPNKTQIHGWGSALTYCRRYALLSAFNIVTKGDDDGQAAGDQRKSSAQLKREGVWEQFAAEMRAATSLQALQAIVERWRPRVAVWSDKWRGAAEELHGQCQERLGGTMQALKDSAERLEHDAHDRDRWERNLADTNRGRW
jgi:uncharacterized protein YukE